MSQSTYLGTRDLYEYTMYFQGYSHNFLIKFYSVLTLKSLCSMYLGASISNNKVQKEEFFFFLMCFSNIQLKHLPVQLYKLALLDAV